MSMRDEEWVTLPVTVNEGGFAHLRGIQFAQCSDTIYNSDWANVNTNVSYNHENRYMTVLGYPIELDCIFKSGPSELFDFELFFDSLPNSNDVTDGVDMFMVEFPDSHAQGSTKPDLLVIKGVRGTAQQNKKIGTLSAYGTYIDISLTFWRRRFSGGSYTDTRIGTNAIHTRIYQENTYDVTAVLNTIEFFYVPQEFLNDFFHMTIGWDYDVVEARCSDPLFFLGVSTQALVPTEGCYYANYQLWFPEKTYFQNYLTGNPSGDTSSYTFGNAGTLGGYDQDRGSHDFHSETISLPPPPSTSVLSTGFYNVYKVTASLLSNFGKALFPTPLIDTTTAGEAIAGLVGQMFNSKATDFIVDCHILPINVPATTTKKITAGGREFVNPDNLQYYYAPTVDSAYIDSDLGAVSIPEAYGNFLDYAVKCKLYLPCYGYVDIPPEYWNGGTIAVKYRFNVIDGSFVAFVFGTAKHSHLHSLIGQYSGCAVTHIPVSSANYSNIIGGLLSVGVGTATTIATGHIAGMNAVREATTMANVATSDGAENASGDNGSFDNNKVGQKLDSLNLVTAGSAMSQMASGLSNVLSMKPSMVNNGTSNPSSAMLMRRKPYLIIEYPTPQFSERYPQEMGLPLNVAGTLGQYGGMTIAENPILDGIPCTASEKMRIRSALASGLIFR